MRLHPTLVQCKELFFAIFFLIPFLIFAQDPNQNWVKELTYKTPTSSPSTNAFVNVTYIDGLGRPIQQVAHQQSATGKDIVTHIEYDQYGRVTKKFLPYKSSNTGMQFTDPQTAYNNTLAYPDYNNQLPYSETAFDGSPLNRPLKSTVPGESSVWGIGSVHTKSYEYVVNTSADNVRMLTVTAELVSDAGAYSAGTLYKYSVTDENGQPSTVFKNDKGQLILERKYRGSSIDTYYLYDQYDNLAYVIPPLAVGNYNVKTLGNLCYQYRYDDRQRMIEQKLPEKEWEYIVYDQLNRVVATGPAFSPFGDGNTGWMLIKYDNLNRPAYTGWYQHAFTGTSRLSLQTANNGAVLNVTKSVGAIVDGITAAYTKPADVPETLRLLSVNYYDNYDFPGAPTAFSNAYFNNSTAKPRGMPTGSWQRVLGSTPTPVLSETSYILYDYRGQAIETSNKNHLLKTTKTSTVYDFVGNVTSSTTVQEMPGGSNTITVKDFYEYTAQGRLLKHTHRKNNEDIELLAFNTYNELGQLVTKMVGGTDVTANTAHQKVDYSYNIRGGLKGINRIEDGMPVMQPGAQYDLFSYGIKYEDNDDTAYVVPKQYNGNISEILWRSSSDNQLRKYGYTYDSLGRLLDAVYQKPYGDTPIRNSYNETIQYDIMGNITGLQRNGNQDTQQTQVAIDNLFYYYDQTSYRVTKIHDATNSTLGFRDSAASTNVAPATTADWDFSYDVKGNIKSDKNKRITSIKYNHLNQPVEIKFNNSNNSVITYLYNASGQKVQKAVTQIPQGAQGAATTTTNYMNGFQYMNNVLQFFPTSEGYVRNTFVNEVNNYSYVYHYTDHLGNVRLSYAKDPATNVLKILEENHYYPYGVKHTNYNSNLNAFAGKAAGGIELKAVAATVPGGSATEQPYNYKYNSIEYQEELLLNMYDMPLRDYDPASGKWFNIDPVTHYDQSPFMAMNGNPVTFSDPSGADGHNWNPYSDMSMNNYGANGTSSPGRNSNGDNDGGSSIFWGSSRMLFEQSFEGHIAAGITTTYDSKQILNIVSAFALANGISRTTYTTLDHTASGGIGGGFYDYKTSLFSLDISDLAIPTHSAGALEYIEGGIALKAVGVVRKLEVAQKIEQYGIKSYSSLRTAIKGQALQAHHLIEKRFANVMETAARSMKSIAVTAVEHQKFTNAWRNAIPYKTINNSFNATKTEVEAAARRIYAEYPEILKALGL